MDSLLRIGSEFSKDSAKNLGDLVDRVFSSAAKNRMEQETVRAAFQFVGTALKVENVSVEGCTLTGEKKTIA